MVRVTVEPNVVLETLSFTLGRPGGYNHWALDAATHLAQGTHSLIVDVDTSGLPPRRYELFAAATIEKDDRNPCHGPTPEAQAIWELGYVSVLAA